MANIDKKFIVSLQGKEFVTYEGLLDVAHQLKLSSIETELIQIPSSENGNQCIVKAVVKTEDGKQFEGYGDADPTNVNRMIAKHSIRMAETRAKARALRDLTNIGMTALEELGDSEEVDEPDRSSSNTQSNTRQAKVSNVSKGKQAIVDNSLASDKQLNYIYKLAKQKNYSPESMASYIKEAYGKDSSKALTKKEASELIKMLNEMAKEG